MKSRDLTLVLVFGMALSACVAGQAGMGEPVLTVDEGGDASVTGAGGSRGGGTAAGGTSGTGGVPAPGGATASGGAVASDGGVPDALGAMDATAGKPDAQGAADATAANHDAQTAATDATEGPPDGQGAPDAQALHPDATAMLDATAALPDAHAALDAISDAAHASAFTVISVTPANDAQGVPLDSTIRATFSANVAPASLDGEAFLVSSAGGRVPGSVAVEGASATFTSAQRLPLHCEATATVAASVSSLAGEALGQPFTWSFQTEDGAWGAEESASGPGYSFGGLYGPWDERLGVADDGSAFTVWAATDPAWKEASLHASRYSPGVGWTPRLGFARGPLGMGSFGVTVAVSGNGEAMVVWAEPVATDGGTSYALYSMHYGTDWEEPSPIPGGLDSVAPGALVARADASGNFVVAELAYSDGYHDGHRDGRAGLFHYTRGSGWDAPLLPSLPVADAGAQPSTISVRTAMDRGGAAIVTWVDQVDTAGPHWVNVARFTPGTGWSDVEKLADAAPGYRYLMAALPAIDAAGNAVVAWLEPTSAASTFHLVASTFSAGTWTAPEQLDDASTVRVNPDLATDGNGGFIATWAQKDALGYQTYAARRTVGAPWSSTLIAPAVSVATAGGATVREPIVPKVAMSANGDALVSLLVHDTLAKTYDAGAVTFTPATGWNAPVHLGEDGNEFARPLMDACGNGTIVWSRRLSSSFFAARHPRGGTWSAATQLDHPTTPVSTILLTAAVGWTGEVVASWHSLPALGMAAVEFR